jgi:hypothetical protein
MSATEAPFARHSADIIVRPGPGLPRRGTREALLLFHRGLVRLDSGECNNPEQAFAEPVQPRADQLFGGTWMSATILSPH